MPPKDEPFWQAVDRIREAEPRYRREAYGFLMFALASAVEALPRERRDDPERRHLTGPELVQGLLGCAAREFGVMAATVFDEWAVRRPEDVGVMVFHLVEAGQLSARPEDRREDFAGGPGLIESLRVERRPPSPDRARGPAGPGVST